MSRTAEGAGAASGRGPSRWSVPEHREHLGGGALELVADAGRARRGARRDQSVHVVARRSPGRSSPGPSRRSTGRSRRTATPAPCRPSSSPWPAARAAASAGADAVPAGHVLAGLGPAEDPRDGPQVVEPGPAARPAPRRRRTRSDVELAQLVDRCRREEVRAPATGRRSAPVRGVGGRGHDVHDAVPARRVARRQRGFGVEQRGRDHRADGRAQVAGGQRGRCRTCRR